MRKNVLKSALMDISKVFEMEINPDGRALRAAFRAMEPTSVIISLARKLGRSVLSNDAQSFFLDMCINDEKSW